MKRDEPESICKSINSDNFSNLGWSEVLDLAIFKAIFLQTPNKFASLKEHLSEFKN